MTWGELRAEIRTSMEDDAGSGNQWTDAELLGHYRDALNDFGLRFPERAMLEVPIVIGTSSYAVDPLVTEMRLVEVVDALKTLQPLVLKPGTSLVTQARREGYVLSGSAIRLYPVPTAVDTMVLHVNRLYEQPVDATSVVPIPIVAVLAIKYFIRALCVERVEFSDANLSRWAQHRDKGLDRRDNPLTPLRTNLMRLYQEQVTELQKTGHYRLV